MTPSTAHSSAELEARLRFETLIADLSSRFVNLTTGEVDREVYRHSGIKSNVPLPLAVGGKPFIGALDFNSTRAQSRWPANLVKRLQPVAPIFTNAHVRIRSNRHFQEREELNCATCAQDPVASFHAAKVGHWLQGNGRLRAIVALAVTLALLIGLQGAVHAEATYPLEGSGYLLRKWSTADGLPEDSATAIAQTRDGYLWIGTWDGLARYNGDSFTVFNPANTPQLPDRGIVNLHADQHDRLWVSTTGGLVVKEGTQWRPLGTNEGWAGNYVRTFAERVNGDILFTTFDGHVLTFENGRLIQLPAPPGQPGQGYLGAVDERGQWWLAQNHFVGYWNDGQWVGVHAPNPTVGRSAVSCAAARDGGVWVLLANELCKFRGSNQVFQSSLPKLKGGIWTMVEDSRTNLWICSYDTGLYQFTADGDLHHWTSTNGLGTLATRMVLEDQEANLWIGTSGDGLKRLTRQRFYTPGGGLPNSQNRSVAPAHDGSVWIALYNGGLRRQEANGTATQIFVPGPINATAYGLSVLEDRAGRLWYGDENHCWVRHGQDYFDKVPLKPVEGARVGALFEDSQGRVWIGTRAGAVVYDGRGFEPRGPEAGLPPGEITSFGEDASGALWAAGANGVFRLMKDQFTTVRGAGGEPLQGVLCFHAEPDGTMWMGTRAATLVRWRNGTTSRIGVEHGWPDREVRGIIADGQGYFWMPSNRGIVRASRTQLHAVADEAEAWLEIQLLDQNDGLPSPECSTTQPNCARDTAGRLWFATQKGVAVIDPSGFRLNARPPPVQVEQLTYHVLRTMPNATKHRTPRASGDGEIRLTAPFSMPLRLPPGSHGLELEFAALSFTAPEKVRFHYQVAGISPAWKDAGNDRRIRFHQLPPGDYVFRLRAANNDGIWNETGASLAFSVLPFFWQTPWFRLGAGLLLVALGGASVWSWSYRKTARALERERSAQALHASQARLEAGSDLAGLGYYEVDYGARTCFFDERFREICGIPPEVRQGLEAVEFWLKHVHADDLPLISQERQKLHDGQVDRVALEYRYLHPTQGQRWLNHSARVASRRAGGGGIRTFGVIRDITLEKQAELEAQELRNNLTHLTRVNTLSALSGSLAHELNQPLGIILSNAQAAQELLAQQPPDVTEVQEVLTDIIAADQRAGNVIERLRVMLKHGQVSLQPLALNQVMEEVVQLMQADLIGRGVTVVRELALDLPPIAGDRVQLQQLVLNLIINAADAMASNASGARRLHLQTRFHQGQVRASVRDEGEGLSVDVERLFQPFYTTKTQGLGLGLSICRSIVTAHHGRLWAEPHPERGAVFIFELPVAGASGEGQVAIGGPEQPRPILLSPPHH